MGLKFHTFVLEFLLLCTLLHSSSSSNELEVENGWFTSVDVDFGFPRSV